MGPGQGDSGRPQTSLSGQHVRISLDAFWKWGHASLLRRIEIKRHVTHVDSLSLYLLISRTGGKPHQSHEFADSLTNSHSLSLPKTFSELPLSLSLQSRGSDNLLSSGFSFKNLIVYSNPQLESEVPSAIPISLLPILLHLPFRIPEASLFQLETIEFYRFSVRIPFAFRKKKTVTLMR